MRTFLSQEKIATFFRKINHDIKRGTIREDNF